MGVHSEYQILDRAVALLGFVVGLRSVSASHGSMLVSMCSHSFVTQVVV